MAALQWGSTSVEQRLSDRVPDLHPDTQQSQVGGFTYLISFDFPFFIFVICVCKSLILVEFAFLHLASIMNLRETFICFSGMFSNDKSTDRRTLDANSNQG